MMFNLWTRYGALNSGPVFDAFSHGAVRLGFKCNSNIPGDNSIDVIWSVLWHGRMADNKRIWEQARKEGRMVIVLEVGSIQRGQTWKVGLNGINRDAYFGPTNNTSERAEKFNLKLLPWRSSGDKILICTQHEKSLQWQNMPKTADWLINTISEIRKYSDREIVIRPHPRSPIYNFKHDFKNVSVQVPAKINGTYDSYDLNFNDYWATINWSSSPAIHSIINGIPAIVGPSSMAYDVAEHDIKNIENPHMPERQQWLNDYAWTEFTLEEIADGLPLSRLTNLL